MVRRAGASPGPEWDGRVRAGALRAASRAANASTKWLAAGGQSRWSTGIIACASPSELPPQLADGLVGRGVNTAGAISAIGPSMYGRFSRSGRGTV